MRLEELFARSRVALVLQEVQNGVVGDAPLFPELAEAAAAVGVVRNAARLADAARHAGAPVVHTTAETVAGGFGANRNARLFGAARRTRPEDAHDSASVQPVAGVLRSGDVVLPRYHGLSPMTGGPLDSLLRNDGVTTVVVAGVSLNVAIPNLVFDAVNRAYQVVVVTDAVAGVPLEYGASVLRHALALVATLGTTDEVIAAWSAAAPEPAGEPATAPGGRR
ncbi:MAG: isochorismatase family protein [Acidimicrobiales bacterium]